jgi:YVTN family beta-propeller protein
VACLCCSARWAVFTGAAPVNAGNAYITNDGSNSVSVIDTDAEKVITTITGAMTAFKEPYGVAVNHAGDKVYITDNDDTTVSVIDTTTNMGDRRQYQ